LRDNQERFWEKLVGQVFLGSGKSVALLEEYIEEKREIGEIPRSQRYPGRPSLASIFANIAASTKQQRNLLIVEAHLDYGYTLIEIDDFLGIHYTRISKVIAATEKKSYFKT